MVCIGKDSGQQVVMTLSMVEIVGRWRGWSSFCSRRGGYAGAS